MSIRRLSDDRPGHSAESDGQLGHYQLIQADPFGDRLVLQRRVERTRQPHDESTALLRRPSLDEPVTIHGVRDQLAQLPVLLGLDEGFSRRRVG
jgi:hypothetical protein